MFWDLSFQYPFGKSEVCFSCIALVQCCWLIWILLSLFNAGNVCLMWMLVEFIYLFIFCSCLLLVSSLVVFGAVMLCCYVMLLCYNNIVKLLLGPEHQWCEDTIRIAQFLLLILLNESHFWGPKHARKLMKLCTRQKWRKFTSDMGFRSGCCKMAQ